jgi:hypothetical protein
MPCCSLGSFYYAKGRNIHAAMMKRPLSRAYHRQSTRWAELGMMMSSQRCQHRANQKERPPPASSLSSGTVGQVSRWLHNEPVRAARPAESGYRPAAQRGWRKCGWCWRFRNGGCHEAEAHVPDCQTQAGLLTVGTRGRGRSNEDTIGCSGELPGKRRLPDSRKTGLAAFKCWLPAHYGCLPGLISKI